MTRARWTLVSILLVGLGLLAVRPLTAQGPPPQAGGLLTPGVRSDDEMRPRLVLGADGRPLRLWERPGEPKKGGGAVFLARGNSPDSWSTLLEIRPTEPGLSARDPLMAVGPGGELAVVYRWWGDDPRVKHLRLARSDDAGRTWEQLPTDVDGNGHAFDPQVAWGAERTLVVAWSDERRKSRAFDIYARRSADGGRTWAPEQVVSAFAASTPLDQHWHPQLEGDGSRRFWLAWVGFRAGRSAVYVARSADGGQTWASPVSVSGASESVYGLSLHRAGERLLVVWQDTRTGRDRIYAASSPDGGSTWTPDARVDHIAAPEPQAAQPSAVLAPDGEAIVAWQDSRGGRDDVYLARSTDGGATWGTADQRVDADDAGTAFSRYPRVTRGARGEVIVAWEDDRAGYEGVYARAWAPDRARWGPELLVAPPRAKMAMRLPQAIGLSDGAVVLAWEEWDYTLGGLAISKRVGGRTVKPTLP